MHDTTNSTFEIRHPALAALGWCEIFESQLANMPMRMPGAVPARVVEERRGEFLVSDGIRVREARISGRMRHDALAREDLPAVGDWVLIGGGAGDNDACVIVQEVLRRKSKVSRKEAGGRTAEQILAANVDTLFLVQALGRDFNLRRLERVFTLARQGGCIPVVVLTKSDLCASPQARVEEVRSVAPDVDVHAVSAITGEGLGDVERHLTHGATVALIGSSGVGKSTLINGFFNEAKLAVGDVRPTDGRGRHTTTHRQLLVRPQGGILIDTPGMREIQLWGGGGGDSDGLESAFDEIASLAHACRFRDCRHRGEPGCAVSEAIDDGLLETERYASFLKLERELAHAARRQRALERLRDRRQARRKRESRSAQRWDLEV